ncbi:hypothetical protein GCM10010168_25250 [Actinoplanes ianthinogenes]|uniref:Uncharacterized protein n=1 Tax=Actinoplanes ianthinogenes TaxID=122358 RepID=A0ABN6CSE7_9ACTN|nr:hypothetical protein [Actinoplanes ianthinogenes]BCJ48165.1 hypothetical protein Aiant_88220 [Actinoplanes ianthinogenes]GGR06908.1 hypothetical protein GCM10010168_25250 [Actinoplanes ianthinogenes]
MLEWVQTVGPILFSWPVAIVIALLVLRKPLARLLERFTGEDVQRLKVGGVELERAIDRVERRQDLQAEEIRAIQIGLKGVLTKHELGLLRGLAGPGPMTIRYEPDLYGYLHRLDGLGFIQPHPGRGLFAIEEEHRDDEHLPVAPHERPPFDLKDYVQITDEGRHYLGILNAILRRAEEHR